MTASLRSSLLVLGLSLRVFSQVVVPHQPAGPITPPAPGLLEDTLAAKKLSPHEKFEYRVVEQFGLRGVLGTAISAGIGQGFNVPEAWGSHWEGYGKRYASGFGVGVSRQVIALGLDDLLHQDPRYFPSNEERFGPRFENVLKQVVIAKNDDGRAVFASSRIVSAFGAGFLANTWQPKGNGSVKDGLER